MQILHPFQGSIQQYLAVISDPDWYRPDQCPQCEAKDALIGHGFYRRTLVDPAFDGVIRVRRYLCRLCQRTVSLLPEFALPWLRFSLSVISLFLVARLLQGRTLAAAALAARQSAMPYQRGQFWIAGFANKLPGSAWRWRRWRRQSPRPTWSSVRFTCCNRSAGSPRIASCSPGCARTCSAGRIFSLPKGGVPRSLRLLPPPEAAHKPFAW